MKKVLLFILCFLIFIGIVNAEDVNVFEKKANVSISNPIFNSDSYSEISSNVKWVGNDIIYNYSFRTEDDNARKVHIGLGNEKKLINNDFYSFNTNYMTIYEDELIDGKRVAIVFEYSGAVNGNYLVPYLHVYDLDMSFAGKVQLPENFEEYFSYSYYYDYNYLIKKVDNKYVVLNYGRNINFINSSCNIAEISFDLSTVKSIDCNLVNFKKYSFDKLDDYDVVIEDNIANFVRKDIITYSKDDLRLELSSNKFEVFKEDIPLFSKVLESKENENFEKFSNAVILNNYIIVIKQNVISHIGKMDRRSITYYEHYSDDLLVYDINGNLVQTINDNHSYLDLDINHDTNQLVVLKKYIDGLCNVSYSGYFSCTAGLSYDVFDMTKEGKMYIEKMVYGGNTSDIEDDKEEVVDNPGTYDKFIILFILLFSGSILFIWKRKKIDF